MDEKKNMPAVADAEPANQTDAEAAIATTEAAATEAASTDNAQAGTETEPRHACGCGCRKHWTPGCEGWSVWRRVAAITASVGTVQKNLTVKSGNGTYTAVAAADIYKAVRGLFAKYGVMVTGQKVEILGQADTPLGANSNGTPRRHRELFVKVTFRVTNVDDPDDFFEVTGFGESMGSDDKVMGKALTYAQKGALGRLFCIATGDDPEEPQGLSEAEAEALQEENKRLMDALNAERAKTARPNGVPSRTKAAAYVEACYAAIEGGREKLANILRKRNAAYPVDGLSDLSDADLFALYGRMTKFVADGLIQPPMLEADGGATDTHAAVSDAKAEASQKADKTAEAAGPAPEAKAASVTVAAPDKNAAPVTTQNAETASEPEKAAEAEATAPTGADDPAAEPAKAKPEPDKKRTRAGKGTGKSTGKATTDDATEQAQAQDAMTAQADNEPAATRQADPADAGTPAAKDPKQDPTAEAWRTKTPDEMDHNELVAFVRKYYDPANQDKMLAFYQKAGQGVESLSDKELRIVVRKKLKSMG